MDAFRCSDCSGSVLSSDPLDFEADFTCQKCEKFYLSKDLQALEEDLSERIEAANKKIESELETLLSACLEHLQPTHYLERLN